MTNRNRKRINRQLVRASRVGLTAVLILIVTVILVLVSRKAPPEKEPEPAVSEVETWTDKVTPWLWLVDADHSLPTSYVPENLVEVQGSHIQLSADAASAYEKMKSEAEVPLFAANGYISAAAQQSLFDEQKQQYLDAGYSEERAALAVKEKYFQGGQDEHQLGQTVDLCTDETLTLDYDFRSTETGHWLRDHAWQYGFVFRADAKSTGIYKPWQLRYVGVVHAQAMYEMNLTLDEYLKYLQEKGTCYLTSQAAGVNIVVYCTESLEQVPLAIKEVSGDNNGHYIVTCYR